MCFLFLRFGGLFYEENEDVLPHSGTSFVLFVWVIINRPRAVTLAFAEYEKGMIVERTQTGRAIARQDPDFREGRPKKLKPEQIDLALSLLAQGKTYRQITTMTGISKSTLIRARKQGA